MEKDKLKKLAKVGDTIVYIGSWESLNKSLTDEQVIWNNNLKKAIANAMKELNIPEEEEVKPKGVEKFTVGKEYEVLESYFSRIRKDYKVVIKDNRGVMVSVFTKNFEERFSKDLLPFKKL